MSDIDKTVQTLFDKLNERKARIAELNTQLTKSWKTTCSFRLIGASSPTNIQTAPIETVEEIAVQLAMIINAHGLAFERLGSPIRDKVQGYTAYEWFGDLQKRMATISIRAENAKLAELETRLNSVLSPEERRRIEVELLAKEI